MRTHTLSALILLAAALGGCTRTFPSALPRASAASPLAAEAPVAVVGRALREEPPLPGDPSEGWEALEPTPGAHPESQQEGHHHAH